MTTSRSGGRAGRRASRAQKAVSDTFDKAWRSWVNPYQPVEQFSADQIEAMALTQIALSGGSSLCFKNCLILVS